MRLYFSCCEHCVGDDFHVIYGRNHHEDTCPDNCNRGEE